MNNLHLTIFSLLLAAFAASVQLPQSQTGFTAIFPSEKKFLVSVRVAMLLPEPPPLDDSTSTNMKSAYSKVRGRKTRSILNVVQVQHDEYVVGRRFP